MMNLSRTFIHWVSTLPNQATLSLVQVVSKGKGCGGGRNCGNSITHRRPNSLCGVYWKTRPLLRTILKKNLSGAWLVCPMQVIYGIMHTYISQLPLHERGVVGMLETTGLSLLVGRVISDASLGDLVGVYYSEKF